MQAIVKEQRVPGLKVATVPKPSPGPGEVLIAVRHAGVCGTDVHIADWDAWAQGRVKPPLVVGHEFAGEIVAAGDGVSELRPGQLVTAEGHIVCGHCLQCRTGNSHICKNTRIIGVDRDGAFAEYIAMMRVFLQMWLLPVRHWRQCPHTIWPSAVTSWPGRSSDTSSPAATISPANSWPTTSGGLMRPSAHASQSAMWTSVPHTPACRTAMSTSRGPGVGFGTVATFNPGARFSFTMACMQTRDAGCVMRDALEDGAREPAVYLQHGARNIAGPLRREERDRRGELVGPAHAAEGDTGDHLAHDLLRRALLALRAGLSEFRDPLRRDEARTHDVHGDPFGGDLVGKSFGEPQDARARGGGEYEPREGLLGGDGR